MGKIATETLTPDPAFDIALYLQVSGGGRVDQKTLDLCETHWPELKEHLKGYRFAPGKSARQGVVLFFLEPAVEGLVEEAWGRSPTEGFALHNLAVTLVMAAAADMVPEIEAGACAPLPTPDRDLKRRLERLGLVWNEAGNVSLQYAVMTPHPYLGGCTVCHLRQTCPKSQAG